MPCSRAANGVILITTKKGNNSKKIGVSFSNNFFYQPFIHYKLQNEYGAGSNGKFNPPVNVNSGIPAGASR